MQMNKSGIMHEIPMYIPLGDTFGIIYIYLPDSNFFILLKMLTISRWFAHSLDALGVGWIKLDTTNSYFILNLFFLQFIKISLIKENTFQ